jgi:uncharacterized protein (DUF2236 family)
MARGGPSYLEPAGDPGLYGPDSVAWRVHANLVSLAIGGVAAVLLELAEPRVRSGVWDHTSFRTDPLARMQRTAAAAMLTTFGPTAAAEATIAHINQLHARIRGVTPDGEPYWAGDPELLGWVHMTAGYGFLNAYLRYVDPTLSAAEQDRYYREGSRNGRAFGVGEPATSAAAVQARLDLMRPRLTAHPILLEFIGIVSGASPVGPLGRPLQHLLVRAAVDLLPSGWAADLQLPVRPLTRRSRLLLRAFATGAAAAPPAPVRQAYARVGRKPDIAAAGLRRLTGSLR